LQSVVRFRTNDLHVPEASVVFTVERILGAISVLPRSIVIGSVSLGSVSLGSDQSHTVTLLDRASPPRRIERVQSDDPTRVLVELHEPESTNATAEGGVMTGTLKVTICMSVSGQIDATIFVHIAGRATPEKIRVTGCIVAPVEARPGEVHLPRFRYGSPL